MNAKPTGTRYQAGSAFGDGAPGGKGVTGVRRPSEGRLRPKAAPRRGLQPLSQRIIAAVQAMSPGKVASYGLVAHLAGNPGAARQVARILHSCSARHDLPWHRVVNARGGISLPGEGGDLQRALLEAEGVGFLADGRVDLVRFLWQDGGGPAPSRPRPPGRRKASRR